MARIEVRERFRLVAWECGIDGCGWATPFVQARYEAVVAEYEAVASFHAEATGHGDVARIELRGVAPRSSAAFCAGGYAAW